MSCRICIVNDSTEIWVSHSVSASELDDYVRCCQMRGQYVVIYRSGQIDLAEATSALLQANRNILPATDDVQAL